MYPLDPLYQKHYGKEYLDSLYMSFVTNPFKFDWKKNLKEENNFIRQSIQSSSPGMTTDVGENEYGIPQGRYLKTNVDDKDGKKILLNDAGDKVSLTSNVQNSRTFGDNLKANLPYLGYTAMGLIGTAAKNNRMQQENKYNQQRYQRALDDSYIPSSYDPYAYNPTGYYGQVGDVVEEDTDLWNYIPQREVKQQEESQPIENENEFQLSKILNERRAKRAQNRREEEPQYDFSSLQPSNVRVSGDSMSRAKQARDYLIGKGLPKEDASAIVGNLLQESQLKTTVLGDGDASFGIAQWNGKRRENLHSFAQSQGKDASDMFTQLDFVLTENRDRFNRDVFSKLPTLQEKTKYFSDNYESPSIPQIGNRIGYAQKVFDLD